MSDNKEAGAQRSVKLMGSKCMGGGRHGGSRQERCRWKVENGRGEEKGWKAIRGRSRGDAAYDEPGEQRFTESERRKRRNSRIAHSSIRCLQIASRHWCHSPNQGHSGTERKAQAGLEIDFQLGHWATHGIHASSALDGQNHRRRTSTGPEPILVRADCPE